MVTVADEGTEGPLIQSDDNGTRNLSLSLECGGATDEQLDWFYNFSWWTEGVLQLAMGMF